MALRGAEQPSYEFIITLLGAAAADEAIKFYQVLFYMMLI